MATTKTTTTVRYVGMLTGGKYVRDIQYVGNDGTKHHAFHYRIEYTDKLAKAKKFVSEKKAAEFLGNALADFKKLRLHKITTTKVETVDEDLTVRNRVNGLQTYTNALGYHPEYVKLRSRLQHAEFNPGYKWMVQVEDRWSSFFKANPHISYHDLLKQSLIDIKNDVKNAGLKRGTFKVCKSPWNTELLSHALFDETCDDFVLQLKLTHSGLDIFELNQEAAKAKMLAIRKETYEFVKSRGLIVDDIDYTSEVD